MEATSRRKEYCSDKYFTVMHMFLEQKYRLFGLMTSYGAHSEKMREREREREREKERMRERLSMV